MDRYVDVNVEGEKMIARLRDKVLITKFTPTEEFVKHYPSLTKPEYMIAFIYNGMGKFDIAFLYDDEEESDALKEFLEKTFKPLYDRAFLNDTALKNTNVREEKVEDLTSKHEEAEEKPKVVELKAQEEKIEARPKRKRKHRTRAINLKLTLQSKT